MNYYANNTCDQPFLRTDIGAGTRETYVGDGDNKVPCISFLVDGPPSVSTKTLFAAKVTVYYTFKDRKA